MLGYKVNINSLPNLVWALETNVDDYMWVNSNKKDQIEISFSKFNEKSIFYNNQWFKLKNNNLGCIITDTPLKSICKSGEVINIITVSATISDFKALPSDFTGADAKNFSYLLLPVFLPNLSLSEELTITKILHKIIHLSTQNGENIKIDFISAFFDLIKKIDDITRSRLQQNEKISQNQKNIYFKKAKFIIEKHYNEKVTLNSVSNQLNISPVYLSKIFKEIGGINFSDYLLSVRLNNAETLLKDSNIPTHKVSSYCGFCDDNYFRKQFKKFFGFGIKEYRSINNSSTLFHELPIRENYK